MPRHYTEWLMRLDWSNQPENSALRDWLGLFDHRMVSLFFWAWEKYRFPLAFERAEPHDATPDAFTQTLLSLVGMGMPTLRRRLIVRGPVSAPAAPLEPLARVDDLALAYYGGLLAHRPRSAAGLEAILNSYFGLPAQVVQCVGQWLELEPRSQTRLGIEGGHNRLGQGAFVGEQVWDVQQKIRVRLGPLSYDQFLEFLPDTTPVPERKSFFLLAHWVRLYVGLDLDFEVQLIPKGPEVPPSQFDAEPVGFRLGWNTWLHGDPFDLDPDDAVFEGGERFELE